MPAGGDKEVGGRCTMERKCVCVCVTQGRECVNGRCGFENVSFMADVQ